MTDEDFIRNMQINTAMMALHPVGVYHEKFHAGSWFVKTPWYRKVACFIGFHRWTLSYVPVQLMKNIKPGQFIPTWLECLYCKKEKHA